jgi:hypothetical protein
LTIARLPDSAVPEGRDRRFWTRPEGATRPRPRSRYREVVMPCFRRYDSGAMVLPRRYNEQDDLPPRTAKSH